MMTPWRKQEKAILLLKRGQESHLKDRCIRGGPPDPLRLELLDKRGLSVPARARALKVEGQNRQTKLLTVEACEAICDTLQEAR